MKQENWRSLKMTSHRKLKQRTMKIHIITLIKKAAKSEVLACWLWYNALHTYPFSANCKVYYDLSINAMDSDFLITFDDCSSKISAVCWVKLDVPSSRFLVSISHFSFPHSSFPPMLGFLLSACACTLRSMFRRTYGADVLLTPIHTCTAFKHSPCRSIIMFLASSSFSCMLWDAACVWGQCLLMPLILVLTLPSGMSFWCTDDYQIYSGNIFHGGKWLPIVCSTMESGFPCFKVSAHIFCLCVLYVLSWHALLASIVTMKFELTWKWENLLYTSPWFITSYLLLSHVGLSLYVLLHKISVVVISRQIQFKCISNMMVLL